jgi:hypothetical protein
MWRNCTEFFPSPKLFPTFEGIKNAGIIKGNLEGNAICYCLNEEGFKKIKLLKTLIPI